MWECGYEYVIMTYEYMSLPTSTTHVHEVYEQFIEGLNMKCIVDY